VENSKPQAQGAQAVRRAVAVLRLVAAAQERGARLTDLVALSGLTRPTVHRILQVLREEGVVEQEESTPRYKIGTELTLLGMARGNRFPIRAVSEPFLHALSEKVGDTVFLSVRQGADSVGIDRISGPYPIQVLVTDVGVRRPLGFGTAGIAFLAAMDAEEAKALLKLNQRRLANQRPVPTNIEEQVARARKVGYAWSAAGLIPLTSAASVAVVDKRGETLAAITIVAMAARLGPARLVAAVDAMQDCARRIAMRHEDVQRSRGK
jgi:DNA-binding IclR family transcriptional regulator